MSTPPEQTFLRLGNPKKKYSKDLVRHVKQQAQWVFDQLKPKDGSKSMEWEKWWKGYAAWIGANEERATKWVNAYFIHKIDTAPLKGKAGSTVKDLVKSAVKAVGVELTKEAEEHLRKVDETKWAPIRAKHEREFKERKIRLMDSITTHFPKMAEIINGGDLVTFRKHMPTTGVIRAARKHFTLIDDAMLVAYQLRFLTVMTQANMTAQRGCHVHMAKWGDFSLYKVDEQAIGLTQSYVNLKREKLAGLPQRAFVGHHRDPLCDPILRLAQYTVWCIINGYAMSEYIFALDTRVTPDSYYELVRDNNRERIIVVMDTVVKILEKEHGITIEEYGKGQKIHIFRSVSGNQAARAGVSNAGINEHLQLSDTSVLGRYVFSHHARAGSVSTKACQGFSQEQDACVHWTEYLPKVPHELLDTLFIGVALKAQCVPSPVLDYLKRAFVCSLALGATPTHVAAMFGHITGADSFVKFKSTMLAYVERQKKRDSESSVGVRQLRNRLKTKDQELSALEVELGVVTTERDECKRKIEQLETTVKELSEEAAVKKRKLNTGTVVAQARIKSLLNDLLEHKSEPRFPKLCHEVVFEQPDGLLAAHRDHVEANGGSFIFKQATADGKKLIRVLVLAAAIHKGTTMPQLQSDKVLYDQDLSRQSNWMGFVDKKRKALSYFKAVPTESWADFIKYVS